MKKYKQQRLFVWSWPYRVQRLCKALGWSLRKLAAVSGIDYLTLARIARHRDHCRKQPLLQNITISRILQLERLYAVHIKRYTKWPAKWDRTPNAYFKRHGIPQLPPVESGRPEDIKKVAVLGANSPDKDKTRKSAFPPEAVRKKRREDYKARGRKISSSWAKRIASGWDWYAARNKTKP